jgi:hypothetical protein
MTRRKKHSVKKKLAKNFLSHLEVYAFWTGFASTIISLMQVLIIASRASGGH